MLTKTSCPLAVLKRFREGLVMRLHFIALLVLFIYQTGIAAVTTITVAADGSGDVKTVQEAVAKVPPNSADRTVIHIKPGTYHEQIIVPKEAANVTFKGDDANTTILTWDRNVNDP